MTLDRTPKTFEQVDSGGNPMITLWRAVILQALDDATHLPSSILTDLEIKRARDWFLKPNRDFEIACGHADICPHATRKYAATQISKFDADPTNERAVKPPVIKKIKPIKVKERYSSSGGGLYTFNGESLYLSQWATKTGIPYATLYSRMRSGNSIEAALTEPIDKRRQRKAKTNTKAQTLPISQPKPGVCADSTTTVGTGGGRHAQDIPEIEFSYGLIE